LQKTEASCKLGEESQTPRKYSYFSYINLMQFRGSKLGIKHFHIVKRKIQVPFGSSEFRRQRTLIYERNSKSFLPTLFAFAKPQSKEFAA